MPADTIAQLGPQLVLYATTGVGILIGLYKYFKKEIDSVQPPKKQDAGSEPVVAATFLDPRLIKELIDTLVESTSQIEREGKRLGRSNLELKEEICNLIEATRVQTDSTLNLLRFMNRQRYINDDVGKE